MYCPDNYSRYELHEDEQEKFLEDLPVCELCGERIQSDYLWDIGGELYHGSCADELYCKFAKDYIG